MPAISGQALGNFIFYKKLAVVLGISPARERMNPARV
jgi:hypothetical protein